MWQNRKFHYQWWLIKVETPTGVYTQEIKAKDKAGAIVQIQKLVKDSNSPENLNKVWWERKSPIKTVFWDTLTLDRTGHAR